ncbi:MAG: vWA domain-containing protein [Aureispira sp.]
MSLDSKNKILVVFVVDTSGSMKGYLAKVSDSLEGLITDIKLERPNYLRVLECAIITTNTSLDHNIKVIKSTTPISELGVIQFETGGDDSLNYGINSGIEVIEDYKKKNQPHSPPILIAITDSSGSATIDKGLSNSLLEQVNQDQYSFWTHVYTDDNNNFEQLKNLVADNIVVNYENKRTLSELLSNPLFSKLDEIIKLQDDDAVLLTKKMKQLKKDLDSKLEEETKKNEEYIKDLFSENKEQLAEEIKELKKHTTKNKKIVVGCLWKLSVFVLSPITLISLTIYLNFDSIFEFNTYYKQEINIENYTPTIVNIENDFEADLERLRQEFSPEVNVDLSLEYHYHNETVSNDCEDCSNSLVLTYTLEDSVSKYSLGKYQVTSNKTTKLSAQFVEAKIEELLDTFDLRGAIKVQITGETDATPIRSKGIPYQNELGSIAGEQYKNLTNDNSINLGSVYLAWNDTIHTNEELAFLRAFAFEKYLMKWTKPFIIKPPTFQHFIRTNSTKGVYYRKVTIRVSLYHVIKKEDRYEISTAT